MKSYLLLISVAVIVVFVSTGCSSRKEKSGSGDNDGKEGTTLTHIGDKVPSFSVVTTAGDQISTTNTEGKVLVLNFFATWCGPCMEELPHFESEVWSRFKDKGLVAVCIGREHSLGEIRRFREDKGFDVPMAPDPQRGIYGKFATKYIPRNYVVGRDGTIKY